MKKIFIILLSLLFAVIMFNCGGTTEPKDDDNQTDGGEPFECKVDGEKWVPNVSENGVTASMAYGWLSITATVIDGTTSEQIIFSLGAVTEPCTINLGSAFTGKYANFLRTVGATSPVSFFTDDSHTGTVEITKFDADKKKVEGTFSFTAKNLTGENTVTVTNGSFSLTYTTN